MATIIELSSRRRQKERPLSSWGGHDLWCVGALLWIASVARAAIGRAEHEVFGAEGTLALACVVLIPWMLWSEGRSPRPR
jgi:hypothetical protein